MAQLEQLFGRLAQPDEHARYEAAEQIARGRAQLLNPALLPFLRIGLTYDNNYVRSFTLAQLAAGCRDPQVAQHFAANGILVDALRYLADANLELAKNAAGLIKSGLDLLFSAPSVELLKQQLSNRSEMIRFRALEAVVDVAHASPEGYERVAKAGLLVPLQEGLQARDMLERLSCLPLVEKLCERAWGFEALQREGIFALLVNQAQRAREHEVMVTNNILYLLGRLTRQSSNKELLPLASLWPLLGAALEDNDPTLNEAGITLCGDILSTKPGAEALNAPAQKSVLSMYLEYMSSGNQMLRICAHRSLTVGLSNVANSATLEQVVAAVPLPGATQVNFTYLLMSYTKQPFPDVRSAVLGVMKALAAFDWGVKLLFTFPGYPEWLIDRRTELTKEGKIEKFEVVKAIAQNSFAKTNLVDAEYRKLERFLREGVFYSKSEAQVLVDDKAG